MVTVGSPGRRWIRKKAPSEMKKRIPSRARNLLTRYLATPPPPISIAVIVEELSASGCSGATGAIALSQ
jgi:hypothetical protein